MNRGWRFCRPLPYHLATAPVGIDCTKGIRPRARGGYNSAGNGLCASSSVESPLSAVRLGAKPLPRDNFAWASQPRLTSRGKRERSWSGKRDSNPRLRPWQGRTLPLSYSRPPRSADRTTANTAQTTSVDADADRRSGRRWTDWAQIRLQSCRFGRNSTATTVLMPSPLTQVTYTGSGGVRGPH